MRQTSAEWLRKSWNEFQIQSMTGEEAAGRIREVGVVALIRSPSAEDALRAVEALCGGGIQERREAHDSGSADSDRNHVCMESGEQITDRARKYLTILKEARSESTVRRHVGIYLMGQALQRASRGIGIGRGRARSEAMLVRFKFHQSVGSTLTIQ